MKRSILKIFFFAFLLLVISCQKDQDKIYLHYLGHSAVYFDFNHEHVVLCDYGKENAYLEWGWNSQIYNAGLSPDILTYSHFHPDHYDSLRTINFNALRISGEIDTLIGDLHIRSIPCAEIDINRYDNYAFLFEYHDFKVLHLGDDQAEIMAVNDSACAQNIKQRYPQDCDIVVLPLERIRRYTLNAVKFTQLLSPRSVLPSQYWSPRSKKDYISNVKELGLEGKKVKYRKRYRGKYTYTKASSKKMILLDVSPAQKKTR